MDLAYEFDVQAVFLISQHLCFNELLLGLISLFSKGITLLINTHHTVMLCLCPLGQFSNQSAELTGTGDARLFGFFTSTPVEVGQLDKGSAQVISSTPLPAVEVPMAWAFSFWGGDFYLYTATFGETTVVLAAAVGAILLLGGATGSRKREEASDESESSDSRDKTEGGGGQG